jgi:hypothetical protein
MQRALAEFGFAAAGAGRLLEGFGIDNVLEEVDALLPSLDPDDVDRSPTVLANPDRVADIEVAPGLEGSSRSQTRP